MSSPPTKRGVVICCQADDGRWLLIRRGRTVSRAPLKVGFPGGQVHAGEDDEAALRRESFEELGLAVKPVRKVWDHRFGPWQLSGWLCRLPQGRLSVHPEEVDQVLWLTREEALAHPDGLPTLGSIFEAIARSQAGA